MFLSRFSRSLSSEGIGVSDERSGSSSSIEKNWTSPLDKAGGGLRACLKTPFTDPEGRHD